jgi:hypothetical protein
VGSAALYASELLQKLSPRTSETVSGHWELFGTLIWQQLTHVIVLKDNVWAVSDPEYVALLNRFRVGEGQLVCGLGSSASDYDMLKGQCLDKLQLDRPSQYELLRKAPVVFGKRCLRDLYNTSKARQFTSQTHQDYHKYLSADRINKQAIEGQDRVHLSYVCMKDLKEALGRLPLIPGMRVMITENLSMGNKIVNGSKRELEDVVYKVIPEGREAVCVYVRMLSFPVATDRLPSSVVLVFPKTVQFSYRPSQSRSVRVSRTQLPLVPAWAFTDYKVQGASLPPVVVDLASARGIQNAYVMLSRATGLQNLGVLQWFPSHRIFTQLQEDLRIELDRILHLDSQTLKWFLKRNATPTSADSE